MARKPKKKFFKINDKVYQQDIYFYIGYTPEEFGSRIKKKFKEDLDTTGEYYGCCYSITNKKGRLIHIIHLKELSYNPSSLAVLFHEVLHCCFGVMRNVGIKYSNSSEESFTYFGDMITSEVLNRYLEGAVK